MSLFLLLTADPHLQLDIEKGLNKLLSPPTLIATSSWEETESSLGSLRDVDGVLLDTRTFSVRENFPLPIIPVDNHFISCGSKIPDLEGKRAEDKKDLYQRVSDFLGLETSPELISGESLRAQSEIDFTKRVFREVTHDLNNQFTTLRGHLPLLEETCPHEAETIRDLIRATERSTKLIHFLEGIFPGALPYHESFRLIDLLRDVVKLGQPLFDAGFHVDVESCDPTLYLQGDSDLLCSLLLKIAWAYTPYKSKISATYRVADENHIEIIIGLESTPVNLEELQSQITPLSSLQPSGQIQLSQTGEKVHCTLPSFKT